MRMIAALLALTISGTAFATEPVPVRPSLETPNLPDNDFESDGDDPAIWVHPDRPRRSIVVTAVKDGGLRVYDLAGKLVQTIDPVSTPAGDGRINNVDIAYGLKLPQGGRIDVAVASDRALDVIRIYRIDGDAAKPLSEISANPNQRAFPQRPKIDGSGLEDNPVEDQNTAYGLALWHDRDDGHLLAAVTQRGKARLGLFRLRARFDGKVAVDFLATFASRCFTTARTCGSRTRMIRCPTGVPSSRAWSSISAAACCTPARRMLASGASI